MQVQIMGIAWYREHDYPEIIRIMADAHVLPGSYREWQQKAERLERETLSRGVQAVRAIIDPKAFPSWCRLRGLKVDANARMQFANQEAYRIGRS